MADLDGIEDIMLELRFDDLTKTITDGYSRATWQELDGKRYISGVLAQIDASAQLALKFGLDSSGAGVVRGEIFYNDGANKCDVFVVPLELRLSMLISGLMKNLDGILP